jgi:EpsI family protein
MSALRLRDRQTEIALASLLVVAAAALAPLWVTLHTQWTDVAMYRHGYVLAAMSGWLAWRALRADAISVSPNWLYVLPLAALLALLIAMELLYLNVPRTFLIPPLAVAVAGLVFGHAAATRLCWPAVLLYGALPVWSVINGVLQSLTTTVVSRALAAANVPAFIEGNFVHLPAGVFEIAEECSGLRYLVVAVTLALFYALAFVHDWRGRAWLVAVGAAAAIVGNWVRVYVIILAGHLTDMQHYLVAGSHSGFGWVIFAVFLIPVLWVARALDTPRPNVRPALRSRNPAGPRVLAAALLASLLIAAPRVAVIASSTGDAEAVVPTGGALPIGGASAWRPSFANAIEEQALYDEQGGPVELYRADYPRQDATHRVIAYGNRFVPPAWQAIAERRRTVNGHDAAFEVVELEGYLGGRRRIVWGWYRVAGSPVIGSGTAKLLELKGLFTGSRAAAAIAVSSVCDIDCETARERLTAFITRPDIAAKLE